MRALWWQFENYFNSAERFITRALFVGILTRLAPDHLRLMAHFRVVVKVAILCSLGLLVAALVLVNAKLLNLAGLLFDCAGISRVFMDEEWKEILEPYKDETKYPYGPPSYITRELIADDDPEQIGISDNDDERTERGRQLYWRRGFVFIVLGFICQFVAAI